MSILIFALTFQHLPGIFPLECCVLFLLHCETIKAKRIIGYLCLSTLQKNEHSNKILTKLLFLNFMCCAVDISSVYWWSTHTAEQQQ